jgi:hypothetical protein
MLGQPLIPLQLSIVTCILGSGRMPFEAPIRCYAAQIMLLLLTATAQDDITTKQLHVMAEMNKSWLFRFFGTGLLTFLSPFHALLF